MIFTSNAPNFSYFTQYNVMIYISKEDGLCNGPAIQLNNACEKINFSLLHTFWIVFLGKY